MIRTRGTEPTTPSLDPVEELTIAAVKMYDALLAFHHAHHPYEKLPFVQLLIHGDRMAWDTTVGGQNVIRSELIADLKKEYKID